MHHTYAKNAEKIILLPCFTKKTVSEILESIKITLKDLADAYIGLARLYERENKADSAIFFAKKGFTIAQSSASSKNGFTKLA